MSGWKMGASVQHLGRLRHDLMYRVALLWISRRVVWLMALTDRTNLKDGTR